MNTSGTGPNSSILGAATLDYLQSTARMQTFGNSVGQGAAEMVLAIAGGARFKCSPLEFAKERGMSPAATRALQASIGSSGGYLIPVELSAEIIELLRARTVIRQNVPEHNRIPLEKGNLTIARQNSGATVGYIGEGASTAYTQESFGDIVLDARKAKAIVPISTDLLRFAQGGIWKLALNDIMEQLAVLEDVNFLRGPGTAYAPKGLRWLASANTVIPAASGGWVSSDVAISDLGSLVETLENNYCHFEQPLWIFPTGVKNYLYDARDAIGGFLFRSGMDQGKFRHFPFVWTQSIPQNLGVDGDATEVYLVDMADVLIGDVPGLRIDSSGEASYSSDGSTLTNSAFDRDETVVRIIAEHDITVRHPVSIGILTGVTIG